MSLHLYADDTQVCGSCHPGDVDAFSASISECTRNVANLMKLNRLQLNSTKTEVLWCVTYCQRNQLPTSAMSVDSVLVDPVTSIRDLGIFIDTDLLMRSHVQ